MMRIRIKIQSHRFPLEVPDDATIATLTAQIASKVEELRAETKSFQLSINGRDPIIEDESVSLLNIGIVPGDLVHVLLTEKTALNPVQQKNVASQSQKLDCVAKEETQGTKEKQTTIKQWIPRLLHEGVTPFLLELYDTSQPCTTHDALFLVLMTLLNEGGLKNEVTDDTRISVENPNIWTLWKKPGGVYKAPLILPGYPNGRCNFVTMSVGPFLVINASVSIKDQRLFQMKLRVDKYVRGDVPFSAGPSMLYQSLREISRNFKDGVILPVLAEIREGLGIPVPGNTFIGIPTELKLHVMALMDVRTLLTLTVTCKELYFIGNDPELWRILCYRDFKNIVPPKTPMNWKMIYIINYEPKKRQKEFTSSHMHRKPPFTHEQNWPCSTRPFFFGIPGIRGGAHDLIPGLYGEDERQRLFNRTRPRFDPVYPHFDEQTRFGGNSNFTFT